MSVKIRLRRTGAKNNPSYRIVATEATAPRDGRFIETLGWYDPKIEGINFELKTERIDHWVSEGAIVSDSVKSMMKRERKVKAEQSA